MLPAALASFVSAPVAETQHGSRFQARPIAEDLWAPLLITTTAHDATQTRRWQTRQRLTVRLRQQRYIPQVDGSPARRAHVVLCQQKALVFDEVEGARDFITKGIVISEKHGTVYVSNVNHAQAYINGTITEGTLEAPFELTSLPALVAVPSVTAPTAPGVPAPPPLPPVLPVSLDDLGPASKRLAINPEMLKRKAEATLRHFTDRITNTELRLQINNTHGHDGVAFLRATEQKMTTPNSVMFRPG